MAAASVWANCTRWWSDTDKDVLQEIRRQVSVEEQIYQQWVEGFIDPDLMFDGSSSIILQNSKKLWNFGLLLIFKVFLSLKVDIRQLRSSFEKNIDRKTFR